MNNILTPDEISDYKDLGKKLDTEKMQPVIESAQITNLKDVLGSKFYFDLMANLTNPDYQDLLNGCSFDVDGIPYQHKGVKALLADYFMAKFVMVINTNLTPFGATTKQSSDSEPTDRNTLKDISTQQLQLAGSRWEIIKMYLDANTESFPHWGMTHNSEGIANSERKFRFRKL